MNDTDGAKQWTNDRTTFQRIYDVLVGTQTFLSAQDFAEQVDCSADGARQALEQLSEMGIAKRRDGRPATYRRNDSYFRWKRVESLVREHSVTELQERVRDLIDTDATFQEKYGVPEPDAVSTADLSVDDHDTLHERWTDLTEWRTVRRDIRVLRRAVERAKLDDVDSVQA